MKVSDFVITFLNKMGIDTCFTISGGGCIHLIDSLRKSNLDVICPHHEQVALMASEGYFRMSNKMALNVVTTGPGSTNSMTGLLGMWLDSIPGITISGQVPLNQLSRGTGCRQIGDQEFDIVQIVKSMTKYATMIENPNDIVEEVKKAYNIALSGRPGPVWIDIPLDIQGADISIRDEDFLNDFQRKITSSDSLNELTKMIAESKKPLVVVGSGIRSSNTYDRLNDFLIKTGIPVVTGPHSGIDCVDNTLKNYCGRVGILGQLTSNKIIQECDLIIGLGTRLPVKMTGYNIKDFSPKSKKVFVDIDPNEMNKHKFDVDLKIHMDLRDFFHEITIPKIDINEWVSYTSNLRQEQEYTHSKHRHLKEYVSFYNLIDRASNVFKNLPIVTSNGTAHVIPLQMYKLNRHQRLFTNVGCASMGYGLPASIGVCVGNNKQDVICIEGDGSLMMNLQDLQTIAHYKLPIKLIVINNDGYISIKMTQTAFFNGKQFASGPDNGVTIPSYEKISNAFGIKYFKIDKNDEVESLLSAAIKEQGPCFIEVFTHPNETHEPKVTHKGIDKNGKIIPGALTDMKITETF